jgi:uncharacterized protein
VSRVKVEGGKVDLGRLSLSSGQARALELQLPLETISLGGQLYEPADPRNAVRLDVSRTTSGHALRLRLEPELSGPCVRCLEPSRFGLRIDAREVDQPGTDDEELRSPYVSSDGEVDVKRWANDAVVLALPAQPLCREDCAGLCVVCGVSLNDADPADHEHGGGGDPRMAKLRDLRIE